MRHTLGWVALLLAAGCAGGSTNSAPTLEDATSSPLEVVTADQADAGVEAPADSARPAPGPASRDEIAALCKLYKKALRSRWDDSRTRQEVGALEFSSGTALAWQRELTSGDVDAALIASREVVTAAAAADLTAECEALVSLVTLSEAMQAAPGALQR